ncbi:MAG: hypothetical protein KGH69_00925 [Candidatus Micrarchaeota archaeon]|nr:hypothetical protein [Candidatus Micrarchaeota archaeon]
MGLYGLLILSVSAAVVVYLHYLIPILYASCGITGSYYSASAAAFIAAENAAMQQQNADQAYAGYLSSINGIRMVLIGDRLYGAVYGMQCPLPKAP